MKTSFVNSIPFFDPWRRNAMLLLCASGNKTGQYRFFIDHPYHTITACSVDLRQTPNIDRVTVA